MLALVLFSKVSLPKGLRPKTMEEHHWDEAAEGDGTKTPGTSWHDRRWKVNGLAPPDPDYKDKKTWSINEANALPPEKRALCMTVMKQIAGARSGHAQRMRPKGKDAAAPTGALAGDAALPELVTCVQSAGGSWTISAHGPSADDAGGDAFWQNERRFEEQWLAEQL